MLKIAICDDDKTSLNLVKDAVSNYLVERHLNAFVLTFNDPIELRDSSKYFDIYLLDVIMPELDGIQLGKILREKNSYSKIIYFSADANYAIEGYKVKASNYLLMPIDPQQLEIVLNDVRQEIKNEISIIPVKNGEARIKVSDLMYVDIQGRNLCYHMFNKNNFESSTLKTSFAKALETLTTHPDFVFINPSLLINLNHIQILDKDNLKFDDDKHTELYFPRSAYSLIKSKWTIQVQ